MRMTTKKAAVLEALSGKGESYFVERGVPPYSATDVAAAINGNLSNVVKTLKLLERDGLVVREVAPRECWNAIAGRHKPRKVACYWNSATMEVDKADAAIWRAGAKARSEAAFARIRL
jgi:hypothetical protein